MEVPTAPSPANPGYGLWWRLPEHRGHAASGIFGQRIYVRPDLNLVIAQHAARENAVGARAVQEAMEAALAEALPASR